MNPVKQFQVFVLIVAILAAMSSAWLFHNAYQLYRYGQRTEGTVVRETRDIRHNGGGFGETISTIGFHTRNGRYIEFTAPGAGSRGRSVKVLYLPRNPGDARVDTFRDVWFNTLFTAIIAMVCLLIAACIGLYTFARKRREARIIATGKPVRTQIIEVLAVKNIVIFGGAPCRLRVRSRDRDSGMTREFVSGFLWRTPQIEIGKSVVITYIDRDKPTNYLVDLDSIQAPAAMHQGPSTTASGPVIRT